MMKNSILLAAASVLLLSVSVQAGCCERQNSCHDDIQQCNPGEFGQGVRTPWDANSVCVGRTCSPPGANGDPHFVGFGGEKYDFHGVEGRFYNIFSEKTTQVNADMTLTSSEGTCLGVIAIKYSTEIGTDEVTVQNRKKNDTSLTVHVNGVEFFPPSNEATWTKALPAGGELQLEWNFRRVPDQLVLNMVKVATPKLTVAVTGAVNHVDIMVPTIKDGLCQVHGVLGQTYKPAGGNAAKSSGDFEMESTTDVMEDYVVSGPFATDDVFNGYGRDVECASHTQALASRKFLQDAASDANGRFVTARAAVMTAGQEFHRFMRY